MLSLGVAQPLERPEEHEAHDEGEEAGEGDGEALVQVPAVTLFPAGRGGEGRWEEPGSTPGVRQGGDGRGRGSGWEAGLDGGREVMARRVERGTGGGIGRGVERGVGWGSGWSGLTSVEGGGVEGLWMGWTHKRQRCLCLKMRKASTTMPMLISIMARESSLQGRKGEWQCGRDGQEGGTHPHLQLRALQEILCPSLT